MQTTECIKTRRSKRLFLNKEIPESVVKEIIQCAVSAPSSMDCQPWHFVIVKKKESKEALTKLKEEGNKDHILTAPITLIVCVDTDKSPGRYIEDGVTATQNILLAAHSLGLGSVYVTGFNTSKPEVASEIRKILNLPKNIMPITILPLGYPNPSETLEEKIIPDLDKIIHHDKW